MSDSDDFGPLVATTPNIPRVIANNRVAEAGPSRTTATATSNKRKKAASVVEQPSDDDDVQEIVLKNSKGQGQSNARARRKPQKQVAEDYEIEDEDLDGGGNVSDEVQEIDPPPTTKARGGSKKPASRIKPESSGVNALASTVAKSKDKAKVKIGPPTKKAPRQENERMDMDPIKVPDDNMEVEDLEPEIKGHTRANNGRLSKVSVPQNPAPQKKNDQVSRLQEQLQRAEEHIADLVRQLEELNQVRTTEPERLLERMELQNQAQAQVHDQMIHEVMAKLGKADTLSRANRNPLFELVTREEVNTETKDLQHEIKTQKEAIRERDMRLKQQEDEITGLRADLKIAELQIKEEIERGKTLLIQAQQRQPASTARSRPGGVLAGNQDPKNGAIVSFYEDLTNVIVPGMKNNPGKYMNTDEWLLTCCYTHRDVVNRDAATRSLSFNLRLCYEPKAGAEQPILSMDQLASSVHYIPQELDKESKEFVESLGFLGNTFTFERDQLSLFLRTLHDHISGEAGDKADETASDDESVQIVE